MPTNGQIDWMRRGHALNPSGLPVYGKPDLEAGFARAGFNFNFTAMTVADDAIANDQSETRAGAYRFGREKRLEHARLDLRGNARAVVHDLYDYLIVLQRSANTDFPFPIYSRDGVVDEIGPHLIEFATVSHDARH